MTVAPRWTRWVPLALGAVVAAAYVAFAPRGGVDDGAAWRAIAGAIGDARAAGAGVAGAAAAIAAWLAIRVGGGDVAAIAGAIAATAVLAGAGPLRHAAPGTFVLAAALGVAALASGERLAAGGGKAWGVACGIAIGAAIAVDRSALSIVVVLGVLLAVRFWHGARWAWIPVPVAAVAWVVAMIPTWRAVSAAPAVMSDTTYAFSLADGVGAIALVAAASGALSILARRSTRWSGAMIVAAIAVGILLDRVAGHEPSATPVLALALAAGAGTSRLARLVSAPLGQACVGTAAAVIVALPAALAAS